MHVHPINVQNNNQSFGKVYRDANARYSTTQEAIWTNIKKTMREPLLQFNGQTAEDYYKSTKNYDFIAEPALNDTILLRGYKNLRQHGIGINKQYYSDEVFKVGTFDIDRPLNVDDIKTSLKERKKTDILYGINMLLIGISMALIAFYEPLMKVIQKNKTPIEVVDSVSNGFKSVINDSTAVNTKLLNTIKK